MKGACGNCSCGDTGIRICGCIHCSDDTQPDPATPEPEPTSSDSVDEPIPSDSVDEPIPSDSEGETSNNDTGLENS